MLGFLKNRQPRAGDKAGEEYKFTGANEMTDLLSDLEGSKTKAHRGFCNSFNKRDSAEYTAVKAAIWEVLDKTRGDFSSDAVSNDAMLQSAQESYGRLAQKCTKYLGKAGGKTKSGKMRKQKVQMILDMAVQDSERIEYYRRENQLMNDQERSGLTWGEIIHSAREALIEVEDITKYTALGSGAKKGDAAARKLNGGIFSPETILEHGKTISFDTSAFNQNYGKGEDRTTKEGEKIRLSNRNVAMSRMAKLVGAEGVLEESQTVKVKDKKTNKVIKGNLMSEAKGTGAADIINEKRASIANKENDTLEKRRNAVGKIMKGTVAKDLSMLQVLDYLCGQGDRNFNNFFLEADSEGNYIHAHGIDNDMAFGTGVDVEKQARDSNGMNGSKLRMVVDSKNNLTIPHMDKTMAMNIKNLTDDEVRFVLEDLIEDKFINTTIQRLHNLQEAIKKEEANETGVFVANDSDWDSKHDNITRNGSAHRGLEIMKKKKASMGDFDSFHILNDMELEEKMDAQYSETYYSMLVEQLMGTGVNATGIRQFKTF